MVTDGNNDDDTTTTAVVLAEVATDVDEHTPMTNDHDTPPPAPLPLSRPPKYVPLVLMMLGCGLAIGDAWLIIETDGSGRSIFLILLQGIVCLVILATSIFMWTLILCPFIYRRE